MGKSPFRNPFRPGAGHAPPYLAGREAERAEFLTLLEQETVLTNMVLTGLRGVGKTVLLDTFRPLAIQHGWRWTQSDLSESVSIAEEQLARKLITDLSVATSTIVVREQSRFFVSSTERETRFGFDALWGLYERTPGLVADKLRAALLAAWDVLRQVEARGVVFAYDEAQNLTDHSAHREYPLSLLLDVFQSVQRQGVPYLLALTGLPTLFPRLVEARTYAERMFHIVELRRLEPPDSREAIVRPIRVEKCPVQFSDESVDRIITLSGGYPYFIQFICREVYDLFIQQVDRGEAVGVPEAEIVQKLDQDFFAGRWARATDRQRDLLHIIASLDSSEDEFTIQEIVDRSRASSIKPFTKSHVSEMLGALGRSGLIYKNRHGRYSFAVPLLGPFIRRQHGH